MCRFSKPKIDFTVYNAITQETPRASLKSQIIKAKNNTLFNQEKEKKKEISKPTSHNLQPLDILSDSITNPNAITHLLRATHIPSSIPNPHIIPITIQRSTAFIRAIHKRHIVFPDLQLRPSSKTGC